MLSNPVVAATAGFSGADLKALCQEAAMGPLRELQAPAEGRLLELFYVDVRTPGAAAKESGERDRLTQREEPGRLLVQGLRLEVDHGQRLLVTGPSGVGKTSLLARLTAGVLPTEVKRPAWDPEWLQIEILG